MTGRVYTFLTPPEDIGIPCQQEEFDLNLLAQQLEIGQYPNEHQMEELERIPLVRKITAPADVMDLEEIEDKIHKYCQLSKLYAETSVELRKKIQTVMGKHSSSLQGVQTVHLNGPKSIPF